MLSTTTATATFCNVLAVCFILLFFFCLSIIQCVHLIFYLFIFFLLFIRSIRHLTHLSHFTLPSAVRSDAEKECTLRFTKWSEMHVIVNRYTTYGDTAQHIYLRARASARVHDFSNVKFYLMRQQPRAYAQKKWLCRSAEMELIHHSWHLNVSFSYFVHIICLFHLNENTNKYGIHFSAPFIHSLHYY